MKAFFNTLWSLFKASCYIVFTILLFIIGIPLCIAVCCFIPIFCVILIIVLPPLALVLGIICLPIYCCIILSKMITTEIQIIKAKGDLDKLKLITSEVDYDSSSTENNRT